MSAQIQSIERAAAVLRLLTGRSRRRGAADLANELDLPKGTVYGILRTLKSVGFVEQDNDSGKYQLVHHVLRPDDTLQTLEVGSLLPLHATALGKVLLAHHPRLVAEVAARGLRSYTDATITDLDQLIAQLDHFSGRGWASEIGELSPGAASIAAPIENRRGVVAGAVAISGEIARLCQDRSPRPEIAAYVMECARAISRDLGATPW